MNSNLSKLGIGMKHIFILLMALIMSGCRDDKSQSFNSALSQALLEAKTLLSVNNEDDRLLSIVFYQPDKDNQFCLMKVFMSDCYASGDISAYSKFGNATVAIYNLADDVFETINKNEITFFSDTIIGYRDTCFMFHSPKKLFYAIHNPDSVVLINDSIDDFPFIQPLRLSRCGGPILIVPITESERFSRDSMEAEEAVQYYRREK